MSRGAKAKRSSQSSIVIFTNGKTTEVAYLKLMKSHFSPAIRQKKVPRIEIFYEDRSPGTVLRKAKSRKYDLGGYSEVWIVVDEDGSDVTHFISECAKQSTKKQQWYAVVSRPCFEVWLIAHYDQVRVYQDQLGAQRHLGKILGRDAKSKDLPHDFPIAEIEAAIGRCALPHTEACPPGSLPPSPGSGMSALALRLLEKLNQT